MSRLFHKRWFRPALIALLGLALLGALGATQVARAVEIDEDGVVGADEVINDDLVLQHASVLMDGTVNGNLIVAGDSAEINGTVKGDLLIRTREATVSGQVNGNIMFLGQSLSLNGTVDGSVFVIAGSARLEPSAAVGYNVLSLGFSLEAEPGSTVGRDVHASGAQVLLAGRVERDAMVEADGLEITGSIGRDVWANVSAPADPMPFPMFGAKRMIPSGLRVEEQAQIDGTLTYTSPVDQADAIRGISDDRVVHQLPAKPEGQQLGLVTWLLERVRELLTLLLLGGLAAWRLPALLNRLAGQVRAKPLPAALWGLVMLIAGPAGLGALAVLVLIAGILLAAITLAELSLATFATGFSGMILVITAGLLFVFYGSKLIVAYLIGKPLLRRLAPQHADKTFWAMMLGVMVYFLASSIPLLGFLVTAVTIIVGLVFSLGAMWLLYRQRRSTPAPAHE